MKARCYLLCGLPGSGKSTWCSKHSNLPVVSRDIIRADLGYIRPGEKAVLSREQEAAVTKAEYERIAKFCRDGKDFVIDDTNLGGRFRDELLQLLRAFNAHIIGINFFTPLAVCIKRRMGQIPEEAMRRMAERLKPLTGEEVDELRSIR